MLHAFKEQLKYLAQTNSEGLVKEIERQVPDKTPHNYLEPIRNLILVMPDLIGQIQIWTNDDLIPSSEKKLYGFVLTYLYHPFDFIPDSKSSLFSYLDDAYFVGSVFVRSDQNLGTEINNLGLKNISKDIHSWMEAVREVIPKETREIDQLLGELINGRSDRFEEVMAEI